jgi:hypothetical protein
MLQSVSKLIRCAAFNPSQAAYWADKIYDEYEIRTLPKEPTIPLDDIIVRQIYYILEPIPRQLIIDCKVQNFYITYRLGRSLPFTPNHGYFVNSEITLNADIFYHPDDPDDFQDESGYRISRSAQTLYHELGHSFSASYDKMSGDLSEQESWLCLSGWSPIPKPGLKRLIIESPGQPPVIGEWFYNPQIAGIDGFTRFYAKRNPEDDWADSFSFYIGNLRDKVPPTKRQYFDNLLKKYY